MIVFLLTPSYLRSQGSCPRILVFGYKVFRYENTTKKKIHKQRGVKVLKETLLVRQRTSDIRVKTDPQFSPSLVGPLFSQSPSLVVFPVLTSMSSL